MMAINLIVTMPLVSYAQDKYEIYHDSICMEATTIKVHQLEIYFLDLLDRIRDIEVDLRVSSEQCDTVSSNDQNGLQHLSGPAANLYRIGENSFFQYKDMDGNVGWVVLEGSNLFEPVINGNQVKFAFQQWISGVSDEELARKVVFVVENLGNLNIGEIEGIVDHFDKILHQPSSLQLSIRADFWPACNIMGNYYHPKCLYDFKEPEKFDEIHVLFHRTNSYKGFLRIARGEQKIYSRDPE
jgi:hypothetical protein